MKTFFACCATFVLGAVCTAGYFYLVEVPRAKEAAYTEGYNGGTVMTSLDLLQKSLHRDVANLKKGD